ncbi:5-oxoprolinase subunit PxpB [Mammaliicoccus stepanovicii]|uniref:Allophanate hydrolase subunit 1 n=1 Tax=Mammaliicoccus stepanovicii TaxID=643214 RepID=A0A239Z4F1_9STAP|nr:5-oxoprolinase subunit PxpB [Mammaliicoccus stepanovicii]PNZ72421.1 allophanate hydrolase [Mammaliicoccus stepanovicii]GGI40153.1 allophanate hydrolase [Mammaliicoccus stepanovicii]SNV65743.1 allophanate hydrolase subunit 1 [Mammaliicoccus stepanovicii]
MDVKVINESHFMIYDKNEIDPSVKDGISLVATQIEQLNHPGIISVTSSYTSIMVEYNALKFDCEDILKDLDIENLRHRKGDVINSKKKIILPVYYGNDFGPDLEYVAEYNKLSVEEVIEIHTRNDYLIYAIGFLPGFPFLGGLDKRIHAPRKETPRNKIKSGSVGIANNQTGLYPKDSPGGWQIIGRTPVDVFNLERDPMILYEAGDFISFKSISEEQYKQIEHEISEGSFDYTILVGEVK